MASISSLSDPDLLAHYNLRNPGVDSLQFALVVHQLASQRRAVLHCRAEYRHDWHVLVRYHIEGTCSQGYPISAVSDTSLSALATLIRELNKRYAQRQRP